PMRFTGSFIFFFSSRRRHTRFSRDWSSDVCSSDLGQCATTETMTIIVNAIPSTPTGDEIQTFGEGATIANIIINPESVVWYANEIGRASCRERVEMLVVDVPFRK